MKAAILTQINYPLSVENIELTNIEFGQVLVKINKSGLCGAQLQEIKGLKGNAKFVPHLLGHEGTGIVEEIGQGVTTVKKGDKVVLHWRKTNGIESNFPSYKWNERTITGGKITTLSEYSIISENRMTKVDDNISDDFCALLGCGLSTGLSVVNKEADIKFGESVLILGAGGVGINCILAANLCNAYPIVAIDINKNKNNLITQNGGILFTIDEIEKSLDFIKKIDCIIDTTGDLDLVSKYLPFLSDQGRCIFVSQPKPSSSLTIQNPIKFFSSNGLTFKTTQAGGFCPEIDIPKYVKLFTNNKIETNKIITDYFSLDQINKAIDKLKTGNSGRIMINVS
jgi:S-(hydroxymethyl)glutathione dehydrogenase/alcohol dehydrogenase